MSLLVHVPGTCHFLVFVSIVLFPLVLCFFYIVQVYCNAFMLRMIPGCLSYTVLLQAADKSRRRTISFSLPNEAGDDIVSTSFGPVLVPEIPGQGVYCSGEPFLFPCLTRRETTLCPPASVQSSFQKYPGREYQNRKEQNIFIFILYAHMHMHTSC